MKDVSEFLASIDLVPPTLPVPIRATYQDACHLVHGQGIRQQPRKLLRQIPGLELVEMQDSDVCCGSAGIYNLTHPDLSLRVLDEKMDRVIATGATTVVASNPGCTMQLVYGARRRGVELELVHVVDLLDRAYGISRTKRFASPVWGALAGPAQTRFARGSLRVQRGDPLRHSSAALRACVAWAATISGDRQVGADWRLGRPDASAAALQG